MTPSNLQLQTQLCSCATWANDWLVSQFLWISKSQVSWSDVTHPATADVFYTFPPYALTLYAHNYITHLICTQNSKELQDNPNNLKIASHAGFWNKLYASAVHRQNFNILEVICLLWMCTPNVCQPFFLIRLSGLSSQCVQLKEKHLIVHSKTDSLQTIPYFPRLSEHACKLNPDAHSATLP